MTSVTQVFNFLMKIMDRLVFLIIGLALLGFLWGVLRYLKSYNNEKERSASVKYIVYGLLSLLVITSLWGFVRLLGNTFGIDLKSTNNGDFYNNIDGNPTITPGIGGNPESGNGSDVPPIDITNPNPTQSANNFWNNISNLFKNN